MPFNFLSDLSSLGGMSQDERQAQFANMEGVRMNPRSPQGGGGGLLSNIWDQISQRRNPQGQQGQQNPLTAWRQTADQWPGQWRNAPNPNAPQPGGGSPQQMPLPRRAPWANAPWTGQRDGMMQNREAMQGMANAPWAGQREGMMQNREAMQAMTPEQRRAAMMERWGGG